MPTKVSAAAGVLTAVVLAVSGCGSDSTGSTAASATASGQPSGSAAPGGGRPGGQQITAVNLNTDGASPGGANTADVVTR